MEKILLVCSAGITSAMFVRKMQDAAEANRLNYTIRSANAAEAKISIDSNDVVLLSPQVKHIEDDISNLIKGNTKVAVIPTEIYAEMDGYAAIKLAEDLLEK